MSTSIDSVRAQEMLDTLLGAMDHDDINAILDNWNGSVISEDGTEILIHDADDERSWGPRHGRATAVEPVEFITWLVGDGPFDPKVYGADIRDDKEWVELIERAREKAGS